MRSSVGRVAAWQLLAFTEAYTAQAERPAAIGPDLAMALQVEASHELNRRFHRTGVPVPQGWRPRMDAIAFTPALQLRRSVAKRTEQLVAPEATITYVHTHMNSKFVRYGQHKQMADLATQTADRAVQTGFRRNPDAPKETAEEALAAGTHTSQYMCSQYNLQCKAAEAERKPAAKERK